MLINWAHRIYYSRSDWLENLNEKLDRHGLYVGTWPRWLSYIDETFLQRRVKERRVDPLTAMRLPDLDLPKMPPDARKALAAVRRHEGHLSSDVLRLAEARGFTAHPCDWVPEPTDRSDDSVLHRQWAIWLAEKGYTRFNASVPLTTKTLHRFGRDARNKAFRKLYEEDRAAAYDLLMALPTPQNADVRLDLMREIGGRALFNGNYPWDVPILKHFQNDPSEKVRDFVTQRLRAMAGKETVEEVATHIAWYLETKGEQIVPRQPAYKDANLFAARYSTTVDALAAAIGLSPSEFAQRLDFDLVKSDFWYVIVNTGSIEVRTIVAKRMIAAGHNGERRLYRDLPRTLWEQGLRVSSQSPYMFSVNDFLGPEIGTLEGTMISELGAYQTMERSVLRELETGQLPVNIRHDELRALGLALNKAAARQVLEEAIALGMAQDNPRLSMLKFNLQL